MINHLADHMVQAKVCSAICALTQSEGLCRALIARYGPGFLGIVATVRFNVSSHIAYDTHVCSENRAAVVNADLVQNIIDAAIEKAYFDSCRSSLVVPCDLLVGHGQYLHRASYDALGTVEALRRNHPGHAELSI